MIGVHPRHVSRYENDYLQPPLKVLRRLAEVFETTVEVLLEERAEDRLVSLIPDPELFEQFQKVSTMGEDDRHAVKTLLSALILKQQMQQALQKG